MRHLLASGLLSILLACGGASVTADAPGTFEPAGLKLVIGVERPKTFVVERDGEVTSTATGTPAMKFEGTELKTTDGTRTLLAVVGDELRAGEKKIATFDGDKLLIADSTFFITDDGVVEVSRHNETKKMRMHFEGSVVGHRRPALVLVAFVFAIYAAANPHTSFDRFVDD